MIRLIPLALASLMALSGCATESGDLRDGPRHAEVDRAPGRHAVEAGADTAGAVLGLVQLVQDINAAEPEGSGPPPAAPDPDADVQAARVARLYYGDTQRPPPSVPVSMPATSPDPAHHPLDPTVALAALHAIDLSTCTENGPGGYGHARVTFGADGHPAGVLLDAPQGLSREAVDCIQKQLGAASVPPFDGSPVTVGTSFYVNSGAASP